MPFCLMHDAAAPSASGLIVFGSCNEAGTVFGEASGWIVLLSFSSGS